MTVIRLAKGDLFLHSPIPFNKALKTQLDSIGRIRHLVSPNKLHYEGMRDWKAHCPDSINWASPGVRERAREQKIAVSFDRDLGESPPAEWAPEIDQCVVHGSRMLTEIVFFHRASKTVMLADLIENFEPNKVNGLLFRTLLRFSGSAHPDGKAPIDLRATFWGQKARAAEDLKRILAWHPDKVILSHGKWYEENGEAELRRAFRWLGRDL
jgi:hypothetical protein